MSQPPGKPVHFPTTHWSLVARASADGDASARQALDGLLRRYLPPMRAYLLLDRKLDAGQVDDLLQGFVASRVLEQNLFARADASRGRFRNLLLASLKRYAIDQLRRRSTQKQGAGQVVSLEATEVDAPADDVPEVSAVFEVELARQIVTTTLARMQQDCVAKGADSTWELFRVQVVAPTLEGTERIPYTDLVERLGFESPSQAANALSTAKRMFRRHLSEVLLEYQFDAEDLEQDVGELMRILAQT